jgi:large subunit ribosomal protein L31
VWQERYATCLQRIDPRLKQKVSLRVIHAVKKERNMAYEKLVKRLNTLSVKSNRNFKMPKKSIHPEWYPDAEVYCDGQLIMTVGSTKPRLNVDIWSGNHPFYTGSQKILDTEGRVERFMRKYGIENKTE